jgi:hypothetical protein
MLAGIPALLRAQANQAYAAQMAAYMKGKFVFLGLKAPERRRLVSASAVLKEFGSPVLFEPAFHAFLRSMFAVSCERELNHVAIDALVHAAKQHKGPATARDLDALKAVLLDLTVPPDNLPPPHWDSVDALASAWCKFFALCSKRRKQQELDDLYMRSSMWLDRVVIIHQLSLGRDTDRDLLVNSINRALGREWPASLDAHSHLVSARKAQAKEFFIAKAIGWSLRQFARTDAAWVKAFVEANDLPVLSQREALKHVGAKKRKKDDDDDDGVDFDDDD